MGCKILTGDCLERLPRLKENSFDAVVTDPPYHLQSIVKRFAKSPRNERTEKTTTPHGRTGRGFMGKTWDGGDIAFRPEFWAEVLRVMKPGAHLVAFGGTRGYHRMACAIEDAGFEIRDSLMWIYGSGFPKSQNIAKFIDKELGAKGKKIITGATVKRMIPGADQHKNGWVKDNGREFDPHAYVPESSQAKEYDGFGTALKPSFEPIVLARKPLSEKTVAANVLRWGTGALNIGACKVSNVTIPGGTLAQNTHLRKSIRSGKGFTPGLGTGPATRETAPNLDGRWPANVVHDGSDEVVGAFPTLGKSQGGSRGGSRNLDFGMGAQPDVKPGFGDSGSAARFFKSCPPKRGRWPANICHDGSDEVVGAFPMLKSSQGGTRGAGGQHGRYSPIGAQPDVTTGYGDSGSAARFFYSSKAKRDDRAGSNHPTVKPVSLKRWLVRMVTPPGGKVLDPFAGSGTTAAACQREGFNCILIEREEEYIAALRRRFPIKEDGWRFSKKKGFFI